jgi:general secretion pathway protein G
MHMNITAQQPGGRHDTGRITMNRPHASRQAGFQLVEMMLVLAILGIVSLVAIPSYLSFLDKVDYVTAETDITDISVVIEQYYSGKGEYPLSLADIGKGNLRDPWENPYYYLRIAGGSGGNGNGNVRKDKSLSPVNSDYDLYSAGKDGQTKAPFPPKVSHDDIVRASNGRFIGYAADF